MRVLIIFMMFFVSISSYADSADDGVVSEVYADTSGKFAIKLRNGSSNATNECSSYNGWIGSHSASPVIISTILAAKATNTTITAVYSGCAPGGHWANLIAVYTK